MPKPKAKALKVLNRIQVGNDLARPDVKLTVKPAPQTPKSIKLKWSNVTVELGKLKPWARNPKFSTKAQAERILESFKEFGQPLPLVIGPDFSVYDGHQRLSALKAQLTLYGPTFKVDCRQSNRPLTEPERRKFVITFHTSAVGQYDWQALAGWDAGELREFGFDYDVLKVLNSDAANLTEMLRASDVTPDFAAVGVDEQGRLDQKKPVTCPECGHEFIPKA